MLVDEASKCRNIPYSHGRNRMRSAAHARISYFQRQELLILVCTRCRQGQRRRSKYLWHAEEETFIAEFWFHAAVASFSLL
jgi:hypothetical protein